VSHKVGFRGMRFRDGLCSKLVGQCLPDQHLVKEAQVGRGEELRCEEAGTEFQLTSGVEVAFWHFLEFRQGSWS
jgi:hypothetical protein